MSRSIYLQADGQLAIRNVTEDYTPQKSQALISVKYSGVNHCDLNFFHVGLHSYITGFEFAGVVEATGPESSLKVGDAVVGTSPISHPQPSGVGMHQDKAIVEDDLTFTIPDGLDLKEAGGIAMSATTAADAIFNILGFGLRAAGVPGTDATDKAVLIWGGASSVGISAIQLAKAAGFSPVLVTASPKNHEVLRRLGATHCFDYQSPSVVEDIRATVEELGLMLGTAFDTVGKGLAPPSQDTEKTSPSLVRKSLSDGIAPDSVRLVCTLPVPHDSSFGFCNSYRPAGNVGAMGSPQDPNFPVRTRKIMSYLLGASERVPSHPNTTFVKGGENGIQEIQKVAHGGASFEKVVIEHPI